MKVTRPPSVAQRLTAFALVVAVLGLACVAASPVLHHWLHESPAPAFAGDDHGCSRHDAGESEDDPQEAPFASEDHACAVTLFAGCALPLLYCILPAIAPTTPEEPSARGPERLAAAFPPYRLIPSHAPPAV